MSRLPPEFIQKIKDANNILDVVGNHVVLKKKGVNHWGLCPFHGERTPSFSVHEEKQHFHCFGCKKGGDVIRFIQELHGLEFAEAVEELAERARIPMPAGFHGGPGAGADPEAVRRYQAEREKLQTLARLNRFVAHYYHQQLARSPEALAYFKKRGVSSVDSVLSQNFYLGYAPGGWEGLVRHLIQGKAPLDLALEVGLILPSTKGAPGAGYRDMFRDRVMFPIADSRGRIVGFGGRALPGGDAEPKYLNSKESVFFDKKKVLYGLWQSQKNVHERDEAIVVEGYFDVIGLHAGGFTNAVAACGTSLSSEHLRMLKRQASKITLLFDRDKAGIAATESSMILGLENGLVLREAVLPEGLDPDEIVLDPEGHASEQGRARMRAILDAAKPAIDVRIEEAIASARQGPEAKSEAIKRVAGWLKKFSDPVGLEVRAQVASQGLGIPRQILDQAMGRQAPSAGALRSTRPNSQPPGQRAEALGARPRTSSAKLPAAEAMMLQALVQGGRPLEQLEKAVDLARERVAPKLSLSDLFEHSEARAFVHRLVNHSHGMPVSDAVSRVLDEQEWDFQVRSTITEALVGKEGGETTPTGADFQAAVKRALRRSLARFSQRIKQALGDAESKQDAELQSKLLKDYLDVQRKMKEFSSFYDEA